MRRHYRKEEILALVPLCEEVRVALDPLRRKLFFRDDWECMCAIASETLVRVLSVFGHNAHLVLGEYVVRDRKRGPESWGEAAYEHCWVQIGDYVLDLTETQFVKTAAAVALHSRRSPKYRVRFRGEQALRETLSWDEQSPLHRGNVYELQRVVTTVVHTHAC